MDVFNSKPRSFKMDRRCPLALELKEMVTKKLIGFLGSYSDDVLAEYIVVLVCNGKHQNQARNDLEAFLGDNSSAFVKWLWEYLSQKMKASEEIDISKLEKESASAASDHATKIVEDERNQFQHSKLEDFHMQGASVTLETPTEIPEAYAKSNSSDPNVRKICECHCQSRTLEQSLSESSHRKDAENESDIGSCHPINSGCGQISVRSENQNKKKLGAAYVSSCCGHVQRLNSHEVSRKAQLDTTGEICAKSPFSTNNTWTNVHGRSADCDLLNHVKKRGSVWDRLGRPSKAEAVEESKEMSGNAVKIVKRARLGHTRETIGRHVLSGDRFTTRSIGEALPFENKRSAVGFGIEHDNSQRGPQELNSSKEMDLSMECVDKHISYGAPISLQKESGVQCGFSKELKMNDDETRKLSFSVSGSQGTSGTSFSEISRASQKQKEKEMVPTSSGTAFLSKTQASCGDSEILPGLHGLTEREKASHGSIHSEVEDVRLRLHQIEMEMCNLRSKHSGINIEVKPQQGRRNILLHPEEDIESRTVFLTNVHFAATKEGLSSHFGKCGSVVKSILLTDTATGQPNGSAYIVFADKEAANCALALSGTSFMSRILKIVRKSDATRSSTVQPLCAPAHRPAQPSAMMPFHTKRTPLVKRLYVASHLKWKRNTTNESFSVVASKNDVSSVTELGAR